MADYAITVTGLDQLQQRMARAQQRLPVVMGQVLTKQLTQAVAYAKERYLTGGTTSDRLAVRSGDLRAAFAHEVTLTPQGATGRLGYLQGPVSHYAATHEGWPTRRNVTVIRPKNATYLTIPLDAAKTPAGVARGRARDYDNTFVARSRGGKLIIFQRTGNGTITPLFLLVRESIVPARPALYPTWDRFVPLILEDLRRSVVQAIEAA